MVTKLVRRRSTKRRQRKLSKRLTKRRLSKRRLSKKLSKRIRNRKVRRGGKPILDVFRSCLGESCTEVSSSSKRPQFNAPSQEAQELLQRHFDEIQRQEQERLATLTPEQREIEEIEGMIELSKYEDSRIPSPTLEMPLAPQQLGATLHDLFDEYGQDIYINDRIESINLNGLLTNKSINYLESLFKDISVIPFGISQGSVKELYVSDNGLSELPNEIGEIKSLETLDISRNNISYLPDTMLKLTALQSLNLSSSGILEVPQWIDNFKLQELFLDNLFLDDKNLPNLGKIKSLRTLSLGYNDLQQFPEWIQRLTNLTRLQVNGNYISEIPPWIGGMKRLKHLHLAKNRLSSGESSLPMSLTNLHNLTTLDISDNPLIIPSDDAVIQELDGKRGLTIVNVNVLEYS